MTPNATDAGDRFSQPRDLDVVADVAADIESPGRALGNARRGRKLEIARIANELRLTPTTIEALERDDYGHLPSPVFVAGYIRTYARLLGLDPEPLIVSFRNLHPDAEAPPPRVRPRSQQTASAGRSLGWLLPVLILPLIAGGAYYWWANSGGARSDIAANRAEPEQAELSDMSPESPPPNQPESRPDSAPAADLPQPTARPVSAAEAEALATAGNSVDFDAVGMTKLAPETASPVAEDDAASVAKEAAEPAASATELVQPTPAEAEPTSGSAVAIAFRGPCWVDIRDADGEVQLFGEMANGDRRVLDGKPPYSLVIGNASAVDMEVGGKPFDVNAVAKGNVARFKLDPTLVGKPSADVD